MPTNITLFGDLSKPATVLIEKISDAIGVCFEPHQIRRVAKAEAEAEIIHAHAQDEITEVHRRAANRFINEEVMKQKNIENITKKAITQLSDSASPKDVDNDWISNFFDKCRIISDDEMQLLWAKVLAGEANLPGKYSRHTVNLLSSLDKKDASLFVALCGFNWHIGDFVPLIFDVQEKIYNRFGINFSTLTHLDDIGLVNFTGISGFMRSPFPKKHVILYYGSPLYIEFKNDTDNALQVGNVLLTNAGQQLAQICGAKPVDGFQDYVIARWQKEGLTCMKVAGQTPKV